MKYRFINSFENFIFESLTAKDAYTKYVVTNLITEKDYIEIRKDTPNKYVAWVCREYIKKENDNNLNSIIDIIRWYVSVENKLKLKNVYEYSYNELIELQFYKYHVGSYIKNKNKSSKVTYSKDGNLLVKVNAHADSIYWAREYKKDTIETGNWCISTPSSDGNYINYRSNGPIVMMILPREDNKYQRIAAVVEGGAGEEGGDPNLKNFDISSIKNDSLRTNYDKKNAVDKEKKIKYNFLMYEFYDTSDNNISSSIVKSILDKYEISINDFNTAVNADAPKPKFEELKLSKSDVTSIKQDDLILLFLSKMLKNDISFFDKKTNMALRNGPIYKDIIDFMDSNVKILYPSILNKDIKDNKPEEFKEYLEKLYKKNYKYFYSNLFVSRNKLSVIIISKHKFTLVPKYRIYKYPNVNGGYISEFQPMGKNLVLNQIYPSLEISIVDILNKKFKKYAPFTKEFITSRNEIQIIFYYKLKQHIIPLQFFINYKAGLDEKYIMDKLINMLNFMKKFKLDDFIVKLINLNHKKRTIFTRGSGSPENMIQIYLPKDLLFDILINIDISNRKEGSYHIVVSNKNINVSQHHGPFSKKFKLNELDKILSFLEASKIDK